jgi:hypothetical protein
MDGNFKYRKNNYKIVTANVENVPLKLDDFSPSFSSYVGSPETCIPVSQSHRRFPHDPHGPLVLLD